MLSTATTAKIQSFFETQIVSPLTGWSEQLSHGDLYGFEEGLYSNLIAFYNVTVQSILSEICMNPIMETAQRDIAATFDAKKLHVRESLIQLRTGHWARVDGLYARVVPDGYKGSRHMNHLWWGVLENASPAYYSTVCLNSVLCPSYEVAGEVLRMQHIDAKFDRMRFLANRVSSQAIQDRVALALKPGETLAGKRVVVSLDGGRVRTRSYKEETNLKGTHKKFNTPWKEPKILVVSTLDDKGKVEKKELPLYDCAFGDDEVIDILKSYLSSLHIAQAQSVQIIADGATWIWNRVKPMLLSLGVAPEKIVETVDYYHALEHLNDALKEMGAPQEGQFGTQVKALLWEGEIDSIKAKFGQACPTWSEDKMNSMFGYFTRNKDRMQYKEFKEQKQLCGSGIVESAIRRIICLRFKCPSSFWKLDNLEGMIYLRCILLSKRWDVFIKNLAR